MNLSLSRSVWLFCAALPLAAPAEQVVISEIMYHPRRGQPEYVELFNHTSNPFDIARWQLTGGVHFEFPDFSTNEPASGFLLPFERMVLSESDPATTRTAYRIPASVRVFGPWSGKLKNGEERITLQDKNGSTVCTVKYADRGHWSPAADGAGHSLVLVDPNAAVDDWRNWTASTHPGGTPGRPPVPNVISSVPNPEIELNLGKVLVDYDAVWRYDDAARDPGPRWREPDFDDRLWRPGPGLLGFEEDPLPAPGLQTVLRQQRQVSFYFRLPFVYRGGAEPPGTQVLIDQILDDGAVYYLNGREIGRSRIPAGPVNLLTRASSTVPDAVEETGVIATPLDALLLGTNVLAVEVHQVKNTSTDLVFGMRLRVTPPAKPGVVINEVFADAEGGFVEFFNAGTEPAPLQGCYISDSPEDLRKRRLDSNLVLAPGGLAAISFAECGLSNTSPLTVCLTSSDGQTGLSALTVNFADDARAIGRRPDGSGHWFRFPEATRGLPNPAHALALALRLNEVHFKGATVDWVEVVNPLEAPVPTADLFLASTRDFSDQVPLTGATHGAGGEPAAAIPGQGFASCAVAFPAKNGEVRLYLVNSARAVLDCGLFGPPTKGDTLQAFPDGSREWYASTTPSRNAANSPARQTEVVINEIMYDPPFGAEGTEFVELLNRGATGVDLSGWRFDEGIVFEFPAGTRIPAGGYLVAAAHADKLREVWGETGKADAETRRGEAAAANFPLPMDRTPSPHPSPPAGERVSEGRVGGNPDRKPATVEPAKTGPAILGDYRGRLRHRGELLRLVDAVGNLADEVDFRARGDWPALAHGGGSSMELIHPWADNSLGSAWRDSDESGKGGWKTYACTNAYLELLTMGRPSDYRELHLFLAGRGHIALRNLGLWKDGVNYLDNPARMSPDGSGASGWLPLGTHWASFVTNGELHLVAEGRGDNRPNHVEIDCVRLQRGARYELRFEARWIAGSSRLIAQTWDHSFGGSFLIELPKRLGTPGARNSVTADQPLDVAQAPPQVDGLGHSPAVPRSTNTVRITARVTSASPLRSVRLLHRLDQSDGDGGWASQPMFDDGKNGGDVAPGDGIFTTEVGDYRTNGSVVQFFVHATAANGKTNSQPRGGAECPALYVVDDRRVRRDLRTDRFIVSAHDLGSMAEGGTAPYGFHHPRLSNHRYNTTFIANEERVFYGGEIRVSGSGFTRGSDLGKAKWQLPIDRPFRGRTEFYYDNDNNLHNRIARYLLYQLGHVTSEAEWTRVIINNTGPYLKQDTEPVTDEFLDRNFKDGSRGELYRIDDEWWFTDSGGRNNQDASWDYKGTDDPARYRAEWQKRTRETQDDYSGLIALFKTYSANRFTQDEIERLLDPQAILQMAAVRAFMNDWDSFTLDRGKNGFLYRRPNDGRFQFFHWDSDLAFRDFSAPFYSERVQNWIEKPYNRRLLFYYLLQLIDLTKSPRFLAWLRMEQAAGALRNVNAPFYLSFFEMRSQFALQTMGRQTRVLFAISSAPGESPTTTRESCTLTGTAPYSVCKVVIEGQPEARVTWSDDVTWVIRGISLKPGENRLTVLALDHCDRAQQRVTSRVQRVSEPPR